MLQYWQVQKPIMPTNESNLMCLRCHATEFRDIERDLEEKETISAEVQEYLARGNLMISEINSQIKESKDDNDRLNVKTRLAELAKFNESYPK